MRIICERCFRRYDVPNQATVGRRMRAKCKCGAHVMVDAVSADCPDVDSQGAPARPTRWFVVAPGWEPLAMEFEQLRRAFEAGRVHAATLVWRHGMEDWLPLVDVPELAQRLRISDSAPGSSGDVATETETIALPRAPTGPSEAASEDPSGSATPEDEALRGETASPPPGVRPELSPARQASSIERPVAIGASETNCTAQANSSSTPASSSDVSDVSDVRRVAPLPAAELSPEVAATRKQRRPRAGLVLSAGAILAMGAIAFAFANWAPGTPTRDLGGERPHTLGQQLNPPAAPRGPRPEVAAAPGLPNPELAHSAVDPAQRTPTHGGTTALEIPDAPDRGSRRHSPAPKADQKSPKPSPPKASAASLPAKSGAARKRRPQPNKSRAQPQTPAAARSPVDPLSPRAPIAKPVEQPASPSASLGSPLRDRSPAPPPPFDAVEARRQLRAAEARAGRCRDAGPTRGSGTVSLRVRRWGRVDRVAHKSQAFVGTPVGVCLMEHFQGLRVAPFSGDKVYLEASFVIE